MSGPVGLVVVSHSSRIAEGIVELAGQMAGSVAIVPAGGTDDGGIGTSFDRVQAAVAEADDGAGVVVLCDLGSAILTAETALDFLDDELRARVRIADAPIVEGAVAAAVAAEGGASLDEVAAAAESAAGGSPASVNTSVPTPAAIDADDPRHPRSAGTTTLTNRDGLHARPAAEFVKLASTYDARVAVNDIDAKSLLRIMSLGLRAGSEVTVTAVGPDAEAAVSGLIALVDGGFGEQ